MKKIQTESIRVSRFTHHALRITLLTLLPLLTPVAPAQPNATNIYTIDLPSALQLAGAQSLDVKIARERLAEARASHAGTVAQFFPWISPGAAYRQHYGKLQDVSGNILDVNKYSYSPGATLNAQVDVGDALYKSLAAKQLVRAADQAVESQRQESVSAAAEGYFKLALARASVAVAADALRITSNYDNQIQHALSAGLAFK